MKHKIFIHLILLIAAIATAPYSAADGFIQVRNFPRSQYSGGPQNWDVAQDSIGRLYVGNRDGMLTFDGERWHKYILPNLTTVRSLMFDSDDSRLYAGGSEEFGYFEADDATGVLDYRSLLPTLSEEKHTDITEVWNIMKEGDRTIWFQCDNHLLRYDGESTQVIATPGRVSCSSLINDHIYIGTEDGGIYRIDKLRFIPVPSTGILKGNRIRGILPFRNGVLIATEINGLFLLRDNIIQPFASDVNDFLKENQLFCCSSSGSDYIFGTVTRGAVVKNFETGATRFMNKESGMQNNTVLKATFDRSGNIWLCLDNGLDYAAYSSPVTNLIGSSSNVGTGYTSHLDGDRIYFGTNQGLFSSAYPFRSSPSPLTLRKELQGQIWSITPIGDGSFFVAGDAGSYFHDRDGFHKIAGLSGTYRIRTLHEEKNTAIASCYDGLHAIHHTDKAWTDAGLISGHPQVRGDFEIDSADNIWISHWLKGVYRLAPDIGAHAIHSARLFTSADGLPSSFNNSVTIYHGTPIIVNQSGFFILNSKSQRFEPHRELSARFSDVEPLSLHCSGDTLLLIDRGGIELLCNDLSDSATMRLSMSKTLDQELVHGFEHVNVLSPGEVIVANQNGFWSIDASMDTDKEWAPHPFVSAIYANADSLVYRAGPIADESFTLPFAMNSLRFDFACPDFASGGAVSYSSFLEGYDSGWSPMSTESSREYTRLPEGTYTLHLRARNLQTDREEETLFSVRILPPWYRSLAAKVVYFILVVALMIVCAHLLLRWKSNAESRLEKRKEQEMEEMRQQAEQEALQKDYEIATLKSEKLEVDIRHKSDELSSATMNVIRKNEILNDIAAKISKIQSVGSLEQSVQKQLAHIQTSIEQNISHDDDWSTFNRNFDIVYGGYTKRLHELHPQLSQSDIRLCCYIKMGLTSKEIAPLINISFKSVEMARYRLRKKMELDSAVSLTEYISTL